jgi:hypothetical protein
MHPLKENIPPRHPEFTVQYLFFRTRHPLNLLLHTNNPPVDPTRHPLLPVSLPSRPSSPPAPPPPTSVPRAQPADGESQREAGRRASPLPWPRLSLSSPPLPHPSADDVRMEIQGKVRRAEAEWPGSRGQEQGAAAWRRQQAARRDSPCPPAHPLSRPPIGHRPVRRSSLSRHRRPSLLPPLGDGLLPSRGGGSRRTVASSLPPSPPPTAQSTNDRAPVGPA